MSDKSPVILAVDTKEIDRAKELISATRESVSIFKLGLEFFLAHGPKGVRDLKEAVGDFDLFLDLKLHDIPNTVASACTSVRDLKPRFLTVHASGGGEMIAAAAQELPESSITAVTVLTSLDTAAIKTLGMNAEIENLCIEMARNATAHGARSIVSSPMEVKMLRATLPSHIELITPGVRPSGSLSHDQKRVMTPHEAIAAGANYVVIGRPITGATNPAQAAREIVASL